MVQQTGGYAASAVPEFREAQLAKFRELAPEIDIVIYHGVDPNRDAPSCGPKIWLSQ